LLRVRFLHPIQYIVYQLKQQIKRTSLRGSKAATSQTSITLSSPNLFQNARLNTVKLSPQYYQVTYHSTAAAMSPTAFKQQVSTLLSELLECDNIIEAIRVNRRLGTTEKLDRLQSGLETSRVTIEADFNDWRRLVGSRMELGDEMSRGVLARAISDLRGTVQKKLKDVATNRVRERHEREVPGFGELYRRWQAIEVTVIQAIHTLGDRLEAANLTPKPTPSPQPRPQPQEPAKPARPQPKSDEAIVSIKELILLTDHLKNSWIEKSVGGRSCFVNMFDEREIAWEKPNGFVKMLPAQPKQAPRRAHFEDEPEPERRRRPTREDSWDTGRGW
jgi:hypothetical protein